MFALLNPRLWLALGLAAVLVFSHFTLYKKGRNDVRKDWDLAKATATADARKIEQHRQNVVDGAGAAAAKRDAALRADVASSRAAVGGLRDQLDATRLYAAQSSEAAAKALAAVSAVSNSCAAALIGMGEAAQGHANDSLMYQEAWPK